MAASLLSGFDRIAELLIQNGANVTVVGQLGRTALYMAAEKGKICFPNAVQSIATAGKLIDFKVISTSPVSTSPKSDTYFPTLSPHGWSSDIFITSIFLGSEVEC